MLSKHFMMRKKIASLHLFTSESEYIEMSRCQQRTDSYLLRNNNTHTHSVWHTVCRVVLQLERHFLPINPRACLYNRIWYKAMKQDSLVHVNSWKSSTVLCHLIKEELIMLSLTNIGRPYGAWRFSGSTRAADKTVLWAVEKVIFLCGAPRSLPTLRRLFVASSLLLDMQMMCL